MRKITLVDIFNPTKLRDWLNKLILKVVVKGDKGIGIQSITSSQYCNVVTVTTTLTDGSTQDHVFTLRGNECFDTSLFLLISCYGDKTKSMICQIEETAKLFNNSWERG